MKNSQMLQYRKSVAQRLFGDQITEHDIGGAYRAYVGGSECVKGFGWVAWTEKSPRKTYE
jgi:hypothetical protein